MYQNAVFGVINRELSLRRFQQALEVILTFKIRWGRDVVPLKSGGCERLETYGVGDAALFGGRQWVLDAGDLRRTAHQLYGVDDAAPC